MKLTENFYLQEFVPPDIFEQFGDNSLWFIDRRMVLFAQMLRTDLGKPITVNNWHTGGQYKESGYRRPDSTTGGDLSQHKLKAALDIKVSGMAPMEVREYLKRNFYKYNGLFGFSTIEKDTPTWVHIDNRWTGLNFLLEVNYR